MIPKFRGKSTDKSNKGQWVYGNLIVDGNNALIVNGIIESEEDYVALGDWCPVDLKTVGQSTGLFDKNKNEVFVGDEIRCTSGCPHEVYIEKEYGGTFIGGMPTIYLKGIDQGYAWTGDEEIIGNIYELESVEE
ncbi:hypothetical protein A9Q68_10120 [Streptococcus bovimastitidis]|uniref:YopX protein domain-containing protein n=1 Tax=Streptococcus bovimastitidis TaxID=1856638 RepID=A0A1L8MKA1_9STRE|nr:YopX family protein [Streptococcus bovimastitidis]OJF71184.1 hypothetical protein A9Q68_10120 [Streptococcus bovimastitidis]